jgi:antitoxin (DNA-binding transcriptional repressor) of toxin-antitoxin stability system
MQKSKTVTAREFQHGFGGMAQALKPGESITVTKRGKPLGHFTRASTRKAPDYLANLKKLGHSRKIGQKLIEGICDLS